MLTTASSPCLHSLAYSSLKDVNGIKDFFKSIIYNEKLNIIKSRTKNNKDRGTYANHISSKNEPALYTWAQNMRHSQKSQPHSCKMSDAYPHPLNNSRTHPVLIILTHTHTQSSYSASSRLWEYGLTVFRSQSFKSCMFLHVNRRHFLFSAQEPTPMSDSHRKFPSIKSAWSRLPAFTEWKTLGGVAMAMRLAARLASTSSCSSLCLSEEKMTLQNEGKVQQRREGDKHRPHKRWTQDKWVLWYLTSLRPSVSVKSTDVYPKKHIYHDYTNVHVCALWLKHF